MSYDARCFELAEHFLQDHESLRGKAGLLAQVIQDAIEEWIDQAIETQKEIES